MGWRTPLGVLLASAVLASGLLVGCAAPPARTTSGNGTSLATGSATTSATTSGPVGGLPTIQPAATGVVLSGPPDSLVDGSAPPAPTSTTDPAGGDDRDAHDRVARGTAPAPPGEAPGGPDAGTVPVGGPDTTPGQGSRPSQRPGSGYVDTALENRLPGTPGWQATRTDRSRLVEGFAEATSVTAGEPVGVHISSTAPTVRIQMLRIGWYGGVGARQVWLSVPVKGGLQAPARRDPVTRMVSAPWHVSATVPTQGLVAGDYLLKLLGSDGASSFVPLVVRESHSSGALLMLNSTLTWLAYNPWGGVNSYQASAVTDDEEAYEDRSVVSSFDRPFARGEGSGGFLDEEYHLVLTAERLGLKLNYAADLDLHARPEVLSGAVGVALLGHSEYWSRQMRAALTAARDRGTNLAFLGANDIFRRIRLQSSPIGEFRQMVNYKNGAADPEKGVDTTADWTRAPFARPAADVTGVQYRCAKARADMVVTDPDAWLFAGLGLVVGQRLPGMIGPEFDRVALSVPTPRPIQIMAHSPVSCYGYPEYSDLAWYTSPSGAGVFAAGTLDWGAGLSSPDPLVRRVVTTVTERALSAIAQPAAGRTVPAVDNVARHYSPAGVPLDAQGKPLVLPRRPSPSPSTRP